MYYFEILTQRNPGMCNSLRIPNNHTPMNVSHKNIISFIMIFEIYTQKLKNIGGDMEIVYLATILNEE